MKNLWVRFGCFLTGYNYSILRGCSEAAFKSVKKYTAAMLIICILWFFIGFTFAQRYLTTNLSGSVIAGIIALVIIVQVERQIILSIKPGILLQASRVALALLMSLLGAAIIDQILLEKDIELEKIAFIQRRVDQILPAKTAELKELIHTLDTTINNKEAERKGYNDECNKHPTLTITETQKQTKIAVRREKTISGGDTLIKEPEITTTINQTPWTNPKCELARQLDTTIANMRGRKAAKENELLLIRPALEHELKSKTGFLDELKIMISLLRNSSEALCFWMLWMLFLLFIEMLVLFSKMGDKGNDYDKAVIHHMNLRMQRLDALAKSATPA